MPESYQGFDLWLTKGRKESKEIREVRVLLCCLNYRYGGVKVEDREGNERLCQGMCEELGTDGDYKTKATEAIKLGFAIAEGITAAYEAGRQKNNVTASVGGIVFDSSTEGTGTIISFDGLSKLLRGRVVLTAAHCLERENHVNKIKNFCGTETIVIDAEKSGFSNDVVIDPKKTCPIVRIYRPKEGYEVDQKNDYALCILKEPITENGERIAGCDVTAFDTDINRIDGAYSMGYGGWHILKDERNTKKRTLNFQADVTQGGKFFEGNEYRGSRAWEGDSGSAIFANVGGKERMVGLLVTTNCDLVLTEEQVGWIQEICDEEGETEREQLIAQAQELGNEYLGGTEKLDLEDRKIQWLLDKGLEAEEALNAICE